MFAGKTERINLLALESPVHRPQTGNTSSQSAASPHSLAPLCLPRALSMNVTEIQHELVLKRRISPYISRYLTVGKDALSCSNNFGELTLIYHLTASHWMSASFFRNALSY